MNVLAINKIETEPIIIISLEIIIQLFDTPSG